MDSLVGYGSDDDNEYDNKYENNSGANTNCPSGQILRRDDDTDYDDVTMDMSEDSDDGSSANAGAASPRGAARRSRSASSEDERRRGDVKGRGGAKGGLDGGRGISKRNRREDEHRNKERSDRDKKRASRSRSSSRRDERNKKRRVSRDKRDRDRHGDEKSSRRDRSNKDRRERRRGSPAPSVKRKPPTDGRRRRSRSARRDSRSSEPESPKKVPALMDLKPFGGDPPPTAVSLARDQARRISGQRFDERPARDRQASPRQVSRERDRNRERRRERGRETRRGREKSGGGRSHGRKRSSSNSRRTSRDKRRRSRSRGRLSSDSNEGKSASSGSMRSSSHDRTDRTRHHPAPVVVDAQPPVPNPTDYRPSYKVSKKLQVMEKMGLQIKTPDGSMATAQMLMARSLAEQAAPPATGTPGVPATATQLPSYYNPGAVNAAKIVHQVQKRKLLWGRGKAEASDVAAPAPAPAAKWQGTMFAQDADGKVASKFMRLMGIKDPAAAQPTPQPEGSDVIRKQEELFSAMQAQYDVARATTHTMRGVGLGFQSAPTFPRQY